MKTTIPTLTVLVILGLHVYFSQLFAQTPIPNFEPQVLDEEIAIGYGLAIGDVDGDGKPDILLADKKEFVWYRNGDWERHVMVSDITERDNVCIAARDINGDGKVEVAVGAQWNPGETTDETASGSVHYLIRPEDPTQTWDVVDLPHVPTIHRMRWVNTGPTSFQLIVLPLHGIGNTKGEGKGVQVLAYDVPEDPKGEWTYSVLDDQMHMTHNFEMDETGDGSVLYIGGKEGINSIEQRGEMWRSASFLLKGHGFGEVRLGKGPQQLTFLSGIEPMHGNVLSVYWRMNENLQRQVLTSDLNQGHALACADLLGQGYDQIVVGWRNPNEANKVGIRMYVLRSDGDWNMHSIDDNGMACEDLNIADLNADNKPDIIACGRATHNLKIYWNK